MKLLNPLLVGYIDGKPIYQGDKSTLCCLLTDGERMKNTIKMGEVLIRGFCNYFGKDLTLCFKLFDCSTFKISLENLYDQIMTESEIKSESVTRFAILRNDYKNISDEEWTEYLNLINNCIEEIFKCNTRARQNLKLEVISNLEKVYSFNYIDTSQVSYQSITNDSYLINSNS
ncbi:hypothetical protein G7B40_033485 [Aetokthonos hydrillicola Thurmond2011]|uniref:Uncharacterized protein n=1 Tax=Aetokthonos hydrillicola Thurmond2011 TaxID=2712845 RepID=A0AAP5ID95_9CYAN|nr:hypothetical protein [Aetokthonos hydrillicola]MBO3459525.1 hypothetical protein [Aetokthonos hydrillicola CCALA 1050]MBW4590274.1 hypothetical protein [Aetokthonos hydrillicola CCALA 1050]MDR9899438.1 hypothetical protein [Aetokthonos hydrillicola Thurmond2011]